MYHGIALAFGSSTETGKRGIIILEPETVSPPSRDAARPTAIAQFHYILSG